MKRLILILMSMFLMSNVICADRVEVQIRYKKALWTCPYCGQEDTEDRNALGGDSYEHTCSKCSKKFNQSGANARFYEGCLNIEKTEYEKMKAADVTKKKDEEFDKWITSVKNPPKPIEPSKKDYEDLYKEKLKEARTYLEQFADKATTEELATVKSDLSVITSVEKKVKEAEPNFGVIQ